MPTEVWAIKMPAGHLCPPAMDDDQAGCFLAWGSKEDAENGLAFQRENYLEQGEGAVIRLK